MKGKKIAFQGEHGAYSEIAATKFFPDSDLIPMKLFQDIFDALRNDSIDCAVVPIENSIEGSVNEIYDLLLDTDKKISGEIFLKINHCLIALPNSTTSTLTKVLSHPQALAQCKNYIKKKKLDAIPTYDTAGSVRLIKEKTILDTAAIASKKAAEFYDMKILDQNIEDRRNNFTRFLVLSNQKTTPTNTDRTSMIFGLKHTPGSLFSVIQEFDHSKINLTKIESRPTKEKPWEYNFYVDFEGHIEEDNVKTTLANIKKKCTFIRILGSYQRGTIN
ncbi:MAG: prephenate dehydratase [Nitrososphaeraceae archaeon]